MVIQSNSINFCINVSILLMIIMMIIVIIDIQYQILSAKHDIKYCRELNYDSMSGLVVVIRFG